MRIVEGRSNIVQVFISQTHFAVEWKSAELTQKHTRECQSVVHLEHGHFSLIYFDIDRKQLCSRSHFVFHHEFYVVFQMMEHTEVFLGKFLLRYERHYLPISCFHLEQHVVLSTSKLLGCKLGMIVGESVVGTDFSAHIDRLREEQGCSTHVARVGAKSINNALSHFVQKFCKSLSPALCSLQQRCQIWKLLQDRRSGFHQLRHTLLKRGYKIGAKIAEGIFLVVAEYRELTPQSHISRRELQPWKRVGACCFVLCRALSHGGSCSSKRSIVAQSHVATFLKRCA